jgi:intracellular sulfur oxidation DsrE/DsrF family protein
MKNTSFISIITLVLLTLAGCATHQNSGSESPKVASPIVAKMASAPPTIGLEVKDNVKVVYHIKVGAVRPDGVAKGVAELRHLIRIYDEQGVTRDKRDIYAVFDADSVPFVLNDEAHSRIGEGDINANAPLIAELIEEGVAVEVCGQRMARDELTAEALLPGVTMVLGGQTRVIELQLRGYAYFRF